MNEPTELPEGTELELTAVDPADELDEKERSRLHAASTIMGERAGWSNASR